MSTQTKSRIPALLEQLDKAMKEESKYFAVKTVGPDRTGEKKWSNTVGYLNVRTSEKAPFSIEVSPGLALSGQVVITIAEKKAKDDDKPAD